LRILAWVAAAALLAALADQGGPSAPGVKVEVLNRDGRLLLQNTSGKDVVIDGYYLVPERRSASGRLDLEVVARVSELDELRKTLVIPIR